MIFFSTVGENLAEALINEPGNHERYAALNILEDELNAGHMVGNHLLLFDEISEPSFKYIVDDIETAKSSALEDMRTIVLKDTMHGNAGI